MKIFHLLPITLLACTAAVASDSQKERGLYDRATAKPDMTLINPMQEKVFQQSGSLTLGGAAGLNRNTGLEREFATAEARFSRSFLGIRNPWFGKKVFTVPKRPPEKKEKFETGAASLGGRNFAARPYPEGNTAATARPANPTRPATVAGSAQGSVTQLATPPKKKLTIEDVREILNKND